MGHTLGAPPRSRRSGTAVRSAGACTGAGPCGRLPRITERSVGNCSVQRSRGAPMSHDLPVPARVGVIGGGRMGAGIAQAFLAAGSAVAVVEAGGDAAEAARG